MNAPIHTRPFNAEHAKAGAPYCCVGGYEATILKWDCRDKDYPFVGVFGENDDSNEWCADGRDAMDHDSDFDLVMTPLGYIDGKPVFVGDDVRDRWGNTIYAYVGMGFDPTHWFWPAPAKAYPETGMSEGEIISSYYCGGPVNGHHQETEAFFRIANAALRHAIDAGQVITKEDHWAALRRLGENLPPVAYAARAERDMTVARSVLAACKARFNDVHCELLSKELIIKLLSGVNIEFPIAEVKP